MSSSSETSSSEDEEIEDKIDWKNELPIRSSRGSRFQPLKGDELDADQEFWNQDAWQDEQDDEYSTEEEEEDRVDDDFHQMEDPDEEIHEAAVVSKPKPKSTSVYKEPYKVKRVLQKKPRVKVKMETMEKRTLRASTLDRSIKFQQKYKDFRQEQDEKAGLEKKKSIVNVKLTQKKMLEEAVKTEALNTYSLNRLERIEELKKIGDDAPKVKHTGTMIRYHSKIGMQNTITILNEESENHVDAILFHQNAKVHRKHRKRIKQ